MFNIAIKITVNDASASPTAVPAKRYHYTEESLKAASDRQTNLEYAVGLLVFSPMQREIANKVLTHSARDELQELLNKQRFLARCHLDAFIAKHNIAF